MDKRTKVGIGVAAGLTGFIIWAVTRKPPEEIFAGEGRASVKIEIYDELGNPVPKNSPAELLDSSSYTARITVTNRSTKLGQPVAASLRIVVFSEAGSEPAIPNKIFIQSEKTQSFAAGQSLAFDYPFTIPSGMGGAMGYIWARVIDPNGVQIATVTEPLNIRAIVLSGSIGPGLIWYDGINWETLVSGRQIPVGKDITIAPMWVNNSSVNMAGHVTLQVTNPLGQKVSLAAVTNQDKTATPGNGYIVQFEPFTASQEGIYTLVAQLTTGEQVLDTIIFTLVGYAEITYGATVVIGL